MSYISPVALLSEQQLATFSTSEFKRIKNELLLHFQLSGEATIEIHDRMYDKDEMVRLLELLQVNPTLHITIFQNKALLLWLEEYDIQFFQDGNAQSIVLQDEVHAKEINILIAEAVNEVWPEEILSFTAETRMMLRQIFIYMSKVEPETMALAYQDTFVALKNFVDSLKEKYPVPYLFKHDLNFHPELQHIVTLEFLEFFKYLPPAFDYCRIKYCKWCNNHVVVPFSEMQMRFSDWPDSSLLVVKEANAIVATIYNAEGHLENARRIDEHLQKGSFGSGGLRIVFGVLLLVFSLIRMGSACNRMNRNDHSSYRQRDYYNNAITKEQTEKILEEYRGTLKHDKDEEVLVEPEIKDSAPIQIRASQFNGSVKLLKEFYTIKGTKDNPDESIVTVETDVIPTNTKEFLAFIPESANKKYAGTERKFKIEFQRKGLPEVKFRHHVNIIFGKSTQLVYRSSNLSKGRAIVKVNEYSSHSKTLKGFVTRMDVLGGIQRVDTIEVTLDASGQIQSIWYNHLAAKIGYTSDANTDGLWRRAWCAVHNFTSLNGISLSPDFGQMIKDMASYTFNSTTKEDSQQQPFRTPNISRKKEELYFLQSSLGDGIAYFAAAQSNYDIKYMIDTKSGMAKGIQMAVLSTNKNEIERVELFVKE